MSNQSALTKDDLKVYHLYRGKRPRQNLAGEHDDRLIISLGKTSLQYDSISVPLGHHYPRMPIDSFLRWAKEEVKEDK